MMKIAGISLNQLRNQQVSIILLLVFIITVACQTDLSTNNCPSQFNITSANVSVGIGRSQIARFFYSTYTGSGQKQKMQSYIIASNDQQIENVAKNEYIWPYIAIGILFAIAFAIIVLCMVFQKSCPPCHSWRRDFAKRPYQRFEIRCVAFFAVIFSVGILATSIAAFSFIPSMQQQLKNTKCSLYNTLDVALNGDGKQWGGFSHIKNQVGNISKLLSSANSQINTYFRDDDSIKNAMDQMKSDNINLHTSNKDAVVDSPLYGAVAPNDKTASWFIFSGLGPTTSPNTMTNDIEAGLNITAVLSSQADSIINSAFIIVQSSATIENNTAASQEALSMYENQLLTFKANLDIFSNKYFDPIFNWGIYVVEVIVGFVLVASLAVIIGAVSIQLLDIYDCRHFLHFGWVVYGITYFGIIFTTFYLLAMGSTGYTFCTYYQGMLTSQTQYNRLGEDYAQNVLNKLDICLHGDGNVLKKFQIEEQMNTVSKLFINIDLFKQYNDPTNAKYINQLTSSTKIANWLVQLENRKIGKTKDVNVAIGTAENAVVAAQYLSDFTLWTTNSPPDGIARCSRDRWVYDVGDCLASQFVYQTPLTEAEGTTIDMSYVTCISFQTKLYQNSPSIWTYTDMQKRYKQIKQTCGGAYTQITNKASPIINYRDSRINLFQGLIDQLTDLQSSHSTFNATLDAFRANLTSFSSTQTIRDLSNFVTNKIDGLLVSSDCGPIAERMHFVYNTFCVNTMGYAVQLGICMIVLLCFMIGGIFTGCVFAQRAATIKRLHKVHQKNFELDQASIHSQTFARKEKSQTSSSSSDED